MICEHPNCSLNVFSMCTNHCRQNVCLEHLIEHGDIFLHDFANLIEYLDASTCRLMEETNHAATQVIERRQRELERINRIYDEEQQEIRKRLTFAETANALLIAKQNQLINSKQQNECYIAQHDLEQIKSYTMQIKQSLLKKEEEEEEETTENCVVNITNAPKSYLCPLTRPNVFGITLEHNIRFGCDGSDYVKYNLTKHFEYYHRMLPECAKRLRDAIIDKQLSHQTKLFSDDEIIVNQEYRIDCPLTDPTNIYGARPTSSTLMHIPCTKKQITFPSMLSHFHLYHKIKYDAAKEIFNAMRNKSLHADLILFDKNQRIGNYVKKKK